MTPWVQRLIILNVLMFFVELTAPGFANYLVLQPHFVWREPWTLVTYMFLHDPRNYMHIGFNMFALWMFGVRVEERMGATKFLTLYFLSGISGALVSLIFTPVAVIGASGAIFGVMLAFARYWPDIQILMFWILPMPARLAVFLMAGIELYFGYTGMQSGVANFCHLGGFAGAWLYLAYIDRRAGTKKFRTKTVSNVPKETLAGWKRVDPQKVHEVNRDEVNRILDKISAKGVASLTPEERLFLSNFVPPDDRVAPPT